MGVLSNIPTWSFGGVAFCRLWVPDQERWFRHRTIRTITPLIGSGRYTDIGGLDWEPLQLVAAFETHAARAALLALHGQTRTLINISGQSISATLLDPAEIDMAGVVFHLACTFEVA